MNTRENKINLKMNEHLNYYKERYTNEWVGIYLQGSQNYSLDYEKSDVDTKIIVLPSFEDLVLNRAPLSTTLILPDNSHCDIKDIRLMFECFKKQNTNFIEILFTEFKIMNPEYETLYQPMFDAREAIAHYNNYAAVNCLAGMLYEKHKALKHPYPSLIEVIEKYKYDPKQLHHIIRVAEFFDRYITGESYENCLVSKNPEYLIEVKRGRHTVEEAEEIANKLLEEMKKKKEEYINTHEVEINREVFTLMNEVLTDILRKSMRKELI